MLSKVLDAKLSHLMKWPDRQTLCETRPSSFRRCFKNSCVIIDCSEVFIEQPSDLLARAQVWSNYKHRATMKFLIGITLQHTFLAVLEAEFPTNEKWKLEPSGLFVAKRCYM